MEYTGSYWIYFRGTRNGRWVSADTLKSAKWIFALENHLTSLSYIAGSKKGPSS